MKDWLRKLGPLFGLMFVFILFAALRPKTFLTVDNLQIMMLQTAVVATAALGMTMVIISGGIDLSVGSAIALSVVTIGVLLEKGASPAAAALGGVMMGAICGAMIGLLITRLRLAPFIVTLGMLGILRGAAKGLVMELPNWVQQIVTGLIIVTAIALDRLRHRRAE